MKRTVSVVAAASGATADVRLDAARTLGEVLPELLRLTGSTAPVLTRGGATLDPAQPVAHLRDGDELVLTDFAPRATSSTARIEVTAGPEAGLSVDLEPGRWLVGREGDGLALTDDQVSRHHLELVVEADGSVEVSDLGSTNGSLLYDAPLGERQLVAWPPGVVLRCGASSLVHGRIFSPAATAVSADGTTVVNRPPRLDTGQTAPTVEFPPAPPPATTGRLPLLASLAPLLAGVVLATVMHRWEFLAFAVMSPLVVLGQSLTDRWGARRANRAAAREHAAATALAEQQLAEALAAETLRRH
ncbi:MAG TPA: FHA domain-containing protein, partial [Mycobacteriales bacterium]|nr:FHA domain-containing protein [Mycobacteriales bacterium]